MMMKILAVPGKHNTEKEGFEEGSEEK